MGGSAATGNVNGNGNTGAQGGNGQGGTGVNNGRRLKQQVPACSRLAISAMCATLGRSAISAQLLNLLSSQLLKSVIASNSNCSPFVAVVGTSPVSYLGC